MSTPLLKRQANYLLAAAIVAANGAYAAENSPEKVEEVVVWATQVKASSVNLSGEAIAIKQADHLSDLLRTIPGVDVGGAHSLNQRITIRSMDDKDLRITIDGANQNTYMYHHMGNLQIHADILQSVDIEVGTNSVVNGGIGGSVRFETKTAKQLLRADQQFGGRVQFSYADNASSSYSLTGYGQLTDSVDFLAYYNAVDRDNYEVGGGKIKGADGAEIPGTDGEVKGLEGDLDDMLIKLGWDLGANQRLELGYEAYTDEGDYSYRPDMGLATDLAIAGNLSLPLTYDTEFTRDTLTLNYDLVWGDNNSLKAALFENNSELERDESAVYGTAYVIGGTATNTGINVLAVSSFDAGLEQTLTYGLDVIEYDTEYEQNGVKASGEEVVDSSIFIEDRVALTDALAIIPGLRYNHYDIDSTVVDDTFDDVTGALAVEYSVIDTLLVKVSATELFKGPEISEVFTGAGLGEAANPNIEAETGMNYELSLAYEDAVLGADRFAAGVTLFQTDIEDYIYDYATPPPSVGGRSWKDNVGDLTVDGFEAYVGYDIGNLRTLLTYSVAESELDAFDEYSALDGARLDREQGDTFSLNVDYELPELQITLHWDALIVDDVSASLGLDSATLDNSKDGYEVHNISARWAPMQVEGLTLTVGVDNVFDEFYASQSSRTGTSVHPRFGQLYLVDYEPGRNAKMTVSYQF